MIVSVGIGLAFVAMLCWGFGDFLIQKSTRKIGDWETLLVICAFGSVVLLPFVWRDLPALFSESRTVLILFALSVILFVAALLDFEALKEGKLAVVEPIWSFEVPAAGILAFLVVGERIDVLQIILIALLIGGLILVSFHKVRKSFRRLLMERGVILAFVAAVTMGAADFFMGWAARVSDPIMANFFLNVFITVATLIYLFGKGRLRKTLKDVFSFGRLLLPMSIFDNTAWVAYAFAMTLAPIAVVTALSESYIIVVVSLGLFVNHEKIQFHQKIGLVIAIAAALTLAAITA